MAGSGGLLEGGSAGFVFPLDQGHDGGDRHDRIFVSDVLPDRPDLITHTLSSAPTLRTHLHIIEDENNSVCRMVAS